MEKRKMNGTENLFSLAERIQNLESASSLNCLAVGHTLHDQFTYGFWASCLFP